MSDHTFVCDNPACRKPATRRTVEQVAVTIFGETVFTPGLYLFWCDACAPQAAEALPDEATVVRADE